MKLFVWDFHGVLDISNRVLEQQGHSERFSEDANRAYYGLKWYEYFERLLPGLSHEEHLALQTACFEFAEENLDVLARHIKPNDHAKEVLAAIHNAKHDQILLSNTRPHDLLWFVSTVGLQRYLPQEKIFGVNAHEKHGVKSDALAHYLSGRTFDDIVIIGDSESDMALKDIRGGTTYFYSHPHSTPKNKVTADYIITDLRKILKEL